MEIDVKEVIKSPIKRATENKPNTALLKEGAVKLTSFLLRKERLNGNERVAIKGVRNDERIYANSFAYFINGQLKGVYSTFPSKKKGAVIKKWNSIGNLKFIDL